MRRWLAALVLFLAAMPSRADELAAGLSTDAIQITSSFRGAEIVLFGALATGTRLGDLRARDIVVVLRGPETPIVVRRKARVAGVYTNVEEARITGLPGYYWLAATQPLAQIAPEATLAKLHLGAKHLSTGLAPAMTPKTGDEFRNAAIRVNTRARLYAEDGAGVTRMGQHLFRAQLRLPAAVPPGRYRAEVYLFAKGALVARASTTLPIGKAGLERRLADYAENAPLPYGLAAVVMALGLGWLGFIVFRRK